MFVQTVVGSEKDIPTDRRVFRTYMLRIDRHSCRLEQYSLHLWAVWDNTPESF